jgi:type IV secretory pathway VirB10-like protein
MTHEPDEQVSRVPEDRAPLREMRLHPDRPPVSRLSRKVLLALGVAASLAIAGALIFALLPRRESNNVEPPSTASRARPEGLAALPHDYTGLPRNVPKLGPPLPGDLGKPILNAGAITSGGMGAGSQEQQRLVQQHEAALTSRLFATTAPAQSQSAPSIPTTSTAATPPPASAATTAPDHKLAFLSGNADHQTESPERLVAPSSPYILEAGAVIPAALITGLRSDLPGHVTAQITENIYDSPTGTILLIPQGSRLFGEYDTQVSFGQRRALLVWNRLILPDGRSIMLERQPGTDVEGYAGLEDGVDNHWGTIFKAAALSTILSVGAEAGTSNSENNLVQAIRQGASQSLSQAGEQVVGRSLDVQPTLTIRPGFPVRVLVTRDLILERYHV